MAPIIAALLPTIVKALASPIVAGTAASWIAQKFGLADSTVEAISRWIDQLKPDDQIALRKLDLEFQQFVLERQNRVELAELGLLAAQIEVNREEAKSPNWFVAGWRPCVGWTCCAALAYAAIIEPILRFGAQVIAGYSGAFPELDTTLTLQILLGILGLAGFRTYEKREGVESRR